MPNWVMNKVSCTNMSKLTELLINEEGNVDFNKITPRPKDLDIEAGYCDYSNIESEGLHSEKDVCELVIIEGFKECYNEKITQEKFVGKIMKNELVVKAIHKLKNFPETSVSYVRNYIAGYFNSKRYGSVNWYDWDLENWGTKWNANETVIDSVVIEFQTAWSIPLPIYVKLSKQLPDEVIEVIYADEDIGSNCGKLLFRNGAEVEKVDIGNPRKFACDVWGYDYEDYRGEYKED